jgi:hypothetical protein
LSGSASFANGNATISSSGDLNLNGNAIINEGDGSVIFDRNNIYSDGGGHLLVQSLMINNNGAPIVNNAYNIGNVFAGENWFVYTGSQANDPAPNIVTCMKMVAGNGASGQTDPTAGLAVANYDQSGNAYDTFVAYFNSQATETGTNYGVFCVNEQADSFLGGGVKILKDTAGHGGTTLMVKAQNNGTPMYLHVTSAGVATWTTTP